VRFFFDNTFPPQLVEIMKQLKVDACHLQDEFPADTPDVQWIPRVGENGWVLVTGDRGISRKPAERLALERANIIAVFMAKGFVHKPIFDLVSSFIKWWPEIERNVNHVKAGTSLHVTINGRVELL